MNRFEHKIRKVLSPEQILGLKEEPEMEIVRIIVNTIDFTKIQRLCLEFGTDQMNVFPEVDQNNKPAIGIYFYGVSFRS